MTGVLASPSSDAPCDLAALAHFRDSALDTSPGWGSNEAEATTGSDALNGLDSACADGYRDRRYLTGILIMEDILALFNVEK